MLWARNFGVGLAPDNALWPGAARRRRNSVWANSALVATVAAPDWAHHVPAEGPLAGVALQAEYERWGAALLLAARNAVLWRCCCLPAHQCEALKPPPSLGCA